MTNIILQELQNCRTIDLGQTLSQSTPYHPNYPPFTMSLQYRHGDWTTPNGMTFASELIFMTGHTGTHIDAVGHCVGHPEIPGTPKTDSTGSGLKGGSVDEIKPIIGRGVLLDCAAFAGLNCLPDTHSISGSELAAVAAAQGVEVLPGDAVLIRTGRGQFWDNASKFFDPNGSSPGPDTDACNWLADRSVALVGTDTLTFETIEPTMAEFGQGHLALFAKSIPIVECLALEELSAAKIWEFIFILSPLKIVGGTGSPVRPFAIVPKVRK